jgi:hypothetical protein
MAHIRRYQVQFASSTGMWEFRISPIDRADDRTMSAYATRDEAVAGAERVCAQIADAGMSCTLLIFDEGGRIEAERVFSEAAPVGR